MSHQPYDAQDSYYGSPSQPYGGYIQPVRNSGVYTQGPYRGSQYGQPTTEVVHTQATYEYAKPVVSPPTSTPQTVVHVEESYRIENHNAHHPRTARDMIRSLSQRARRHMHMPGATRETHVTSTSTSTVISQNNTPAYTPAYEKKKRVKVCCCFRSTRSCCGTFCLLFLAIAITVGVLLWYYWPHMPQVGHKAELATSTDGFAERSPSNPWKPNITPPDLSRLDLLATYGIGVGYGLELWVDNQNRYDIAVDSFYAIGRVKDEAGNYISSDKINGTIDILNVNFPKKTNHTEKIPVYLGYSSSALDILKGDPALQLLSSACDVAFLNYKPSGQKPKIKIDIDVKLLPRVLRPFNVKIPLPTISVEQECPPALATMLRQEVQKLAPLQAAADKFGDATRGLNSATSILGAITDGIPAVTSIVAQLPTQLPSQPPVPNIPAPSLTPQVASPTAVPLRTTSTPAVVTSRSIPVVTDLPVSARR